MDKWEYLVFSRHGGMWTDQKNDPRSPQEKINDFGKDGWELVSVLYDTSSYNFYMKRPREVKKSKPSTRAKKPENKKV